MRIDKLSDDCSRHIKTSADPAQPGRHKYDKNCTCFITCRGTMGGRFHVKARE
jgi:hypothetical protein